MTDDLRRQVVALLPRLRRFAYALTRDMDRGDDLVQEVCVRALSRLDQWQEGTRLDSWLYRITQNLWLDHLRAGKVRGEQVDIDAVHDIAGDDGRDITESRQNLSVVAKAIEKLPPDHRLVIALVCIDGLSYKEAADILDVPIGTVMSRLARARISISATTQDADPAFPTIQPRQSRGRPVR